VISGENADADEADRCADETTTSALAAIKNLCILYRTHKEMSRLSKIFAGQFDSVLLNDSFLTSDNVWALWGVSVDHTLTPPRQSYTRMEVLFFSQVIEPIDGYPTLSRLTVTYQLKSNIIGALKHFQVRCGIGKGMREFALVQERLKRPEIQRHLDTLTKGSSTTTTHMRKGSASKPDVSSSASSKSPDPSTSSTTTRERTISSLIKSPLKPAGVQLADFDVLSVCGRGGFGKVLRVQRSDTSKDKKEYAMKVISKQKMMAKRQVSHVIVERKILSRLSGLSTDAAAKMSPFVVRLFWAFQTRTHLFLVMEFVAGGDLLTRLIKRGRLSVKLCRLYAAEIALALQHLHRCGIVYRDMKPENILITKDGHLKLADFGVSYIRPIAKNDSASSPVLEKFSLEGEGGPRSFVGTEIYMAPELISKAVRARRHGEDGRKIRRTAKPYDGVAVDYWGFGVVLYNMLTARHPFITGRGKSGNSRVETLQNIMSSDFVPRHISDVGNASKSAELLLTSLFVRDPRRRLKGADVRRHSFFRSIDWDAVASMKVDLPCEARSSMRVGSSSDAKDAPFEREYSSLLSAIQSTRRVAVDEDAGEDRKVPMKTDPRQSFYHEMDIFMGFTYNAEEDGEADAFDIIASDIPPTPPGSPPRKEGIRKSGVAASGV